MNHNYRRYFIIFILFLVLLVSLTKYYDNQSIDGLAYVVAIGLDEGEKEKLKLTLQIAIPTAFSDEKSSDQSNSSLVNSIECSSINSGISLFNSYLGKEVNLSHCKVLVISESLAAKGISEYIYTLTNNIEFRTNANMIVSKCDADDFLNYSTPQLENLAARYYQLAPASSSYTGYTQSVTVEEVYTAIYDSFREPFAILGSVNSPYTHKMDSYYSENDDNEANKSSLSSYADTSTYGVSSKEGSYLAGQTPLSSENNIETMGIAVFKEDKFVGNLTGLESICHLVISDKLKNAQIRIPSPVSNLDYIDLSLKMHNDTKKSVRLVNGTPYIECKVRLDAQMLSMNNGIDLDDPSEIRKIEESAQKYFEKHLLEYLYKTAKDYGSDIDGFGKNALKYFPTLSDWYPYNWLHRYKDAFFTVDVDIDLKSSYLLVDTK